MNKDERLRLKAKINSWVAAIQALEAERFAMVTANGVAAYQQIQTLPYNEDSFLDNATSLWSIHHKLQELSENE